MYVDFHYKNKTVIEPSYIYNDNSYTDKSVSLYRDGPLGAIQISYKTYKI